MTASGGCHVSHSSRRTHPVRPSPRPSITPPSPHRHTTQAAVRSHNHKLGSTCAGASGKAQKGPPKTDMKSGGKKGGKAAAPGSDASAPWPVATRETTYSHLNALVCLSPPPSPGPFPLFFFEQTNFCSTGARKRLTLGFELTAEVGAGGVATYNSARPAPPPSPLARLCGLSPLLLLPSYLASSCCLACSRSLSLALSLSLAHFLLPVPPSAAPYHSDTRRAQIQPARESHRARPHAVTSLGPQGPKVSKTRNPKP
jgi:hypothetical protein